MDSHLTITVIAGWLLIGGLLAWALAFAWKRSMHDTGPLPLFGLLNRRGLALEQLCDVAGAQAVGLAVRRCTFCRSRDACAQRSADADAIPEGCPNATLFAQLTPRG